MNAVFVFDGPMFCDRDGVYCNTTITTQMLSRYLTVADKLYIIIRTIHIPQSYKELNLQKVITNDRLKIIEIPNILTPLEFIKRKKYFLLMRNYISKSDLIFLRIPSLTSNMAAKICKKLGKPYFAEVGGCAWDSFFNHSLLGKLVAPYMYYKQKKVVKEAAFCSYVTHRWLQTRYPSKGKIFVASNVYLDSFDEENIKKRCRTILNSDIVRIGTIASVDVKYKGQEYVIKALSILKNKGYNILYEMVGAGEGKRLKKLAIRENVSDSVKFLGTKLHEDIWQWLDKIDIYIQPSKQEGLPRALIEAMNRGCLTAGSTTAGIPELIENDTVFKNGSPKMIAQIIEMLILETNYSHRILRNFSKSKEFAIDKLNKIREEAYKEYRNYCLNHKATN